MAKNKMDAVVRKPSECTPVELATFQKLVEEGGEVSFRGLRQRIERAVALVFITESECIAVGAIKQPIKSYKEGVFSKAGVSKESNRFRYELGWLYVKPEARGKRLGHSLMQAVIAYLGGSSCYATTRENNDKMRHLFSQYGFNSLGASYPSDNGYSLVLYVNTP